MHPSSCDRLAGSALVGLAATIWGTWPLFVRGAGMSTPQVALTVFAIMSAAAPFTLRRRALRDRGATIALAGVGLADAARGGRCTLRRSRSAGWRSSFAP